MRACEKPSSGFQINDPTQLRLHIVHPSHFAPQNPTVYSGSESICFSKMWKEHQGFPLYATRNLYASTLQLPISIRQVLDVKPSSQSLQLDLVKSGVSAYKGFHR
jgi:hypothetical protein